jgi:CubicO group peptidase (beta-lactamase class C family)
VNLAYVVTLALLGLCLAGPARAAVDAEALGERLAQRLQGLAEGGHFSGELLVARRGHTVRTQSFGEVQAGALYRIASVTKGFTAGAILLLVDRGRLRLTDPVAKFFPGLPPGHLRVGRDEVTIDHLLSHSAGFTIKVPDRLVTPDEIEAALRAGSFFAAPGAQPRYSNGGYVVLGEIIRRVSGSSYEAFLRKDVWTPLGLNDTGIVANEAQRARMSAGQLGTWLGLRPVHAVYPDRRSDYLQWEGGADGAIFSTVVDLTRWLDVLGAGQFLSAAAHRRLFEPIIEDYARGFFVAWQGADAGNPRKLVWHNGGLPREGFQSFVGLYPEDGVTVVVLANVDDSAVQLTPVVQGVLQGTAGQDIPHDKSRRVLATVLSVHLAQIWAALTAATLLTRSARRPRPWPRQLLRAAGMFAICGPGLLLGSKLGVAVGLGLLAAFCAWFVFNHRSNERWIRGEAALAVCAAIAAVLLVGALAVARWSVDF